MNYQVLQIDSQVIPNEEIVSVLQHHLMLPQLVKEIIIDQAIAHITCTPEEENLSKTLFFQQYQIDSEEKLCEWLKQHQLNIEQLKEIVSRGIKIEKFKQEKWSPVIESYFLKRKPQLDRIIYSLIRLNDGGMAQELYFRILEGEETFAQIAQKYSQGHEANTGGLIGPVEISVPHPAITQRLRTSFVGKLHPPMRIEEWWVIVRLEKLIPAQLDEGMTQKLLQELFLTWLNQEALTKFSLESLDASMNIKNKDLVITENLDTHVKTAREIPEPKCLEDQAENLILNEEISPRQKLNKPKVKSANQWLKIEPKWLPILTGISLTGLLIYVGVIYVGLGNILEMIGLDVHHQQLVKAQTSYESGNLAEAIALIKTIPQDSKLYLESQNTLKQWQLEWQTGQKQLKQIEASFHAKQWQKVIQDGQKIPANSALQQQLKPLVNEAKANLDQEVKPLLQKAINHAQVQEFSEALTYLKQIPVESSFGSLVQKKLAEYEAKKEMRANYILQQAFNAAQQREFRKAINFLQKIPVDSNKGTIAQQKIVEYSKMQNIKQMIQNKQIVYVPIYNLNPGILLQEI